MTIIKSEERAIVQRAPTLDAPLVTAAQAKQMWQDYQELEEAILGDDDYMWSLEYEYTRQGDNRPRIGRTTYRNRAAAEEAQKQKPNSNIAKRKVKSACRKMGKFFGLEIPEDGQGQIEVRREGDFTLQIERGQGYSITEWLGPLPGRNGVVQALRTIKASAVVFVRSASGRTWMGKGGAHYTEDFEDFAVAATAFTRALNRAILDFVGFGDESAEDTPASEPLGKTRTPTSAPAPTEKAEAIRAQYTEARNKVVELVAEQGWESKWVTGVIKERYQLDKLGQLRLNQLGDLLGFLQDVVTQTAPPPEDDSGLPPGEARDKAELEAAVLRSNYDNVDDWCKQFLRVPNLAAWRAAGKTFAQAWAFVPGGKPHEGGG